MPCFLHDLAYGPASDIDRAEADKLFRDDINKILILNDVGAVAAAAIATSYYLAVRAAGEEHYVGQGDSS